jgi:hypothetical protein
VLESSVEREMLQQGAVPKGVRRRLQAVNATSRWVFDQPLWHVTAPCGADGPPRDSFSQTSFVHLEFFLGQPVCKL